ncbi:MAG: ribonuclease III [Sphingomonas sp.]|uniref:ribonuclease III n=1 Tax=Sphingomonas sp. TaxID=28214 RepID=UPI0017DC6CC6|nr:ribonuclease III [Sphingomonas sp.]MBA3668136.1 ribonuclease III [Sphingomonas sp.]
MIDLPPFIAEALTLPPKDSKLFQRALTHGSHGGETYERLEFLGDRVLGLVVANWLYERFPTEPEGKMSRRYNALVARETCAEVGRAIDLPRHIRLGKQAREDQANLSDNVVGDVVEALLGAIFLEGGLECADAFVRSHWSPFLDGQLRAPVHPKSDLQERAAEKKLGVPLYELVTRFGPHHAPRFRVKVSLPRHGEAEAEGDSKQEAETAAAAALVEKLK